MLLAAHDFSSSTILDHDLSKLFLPCIDAYNIKRGAKEQLEFQPLINYASASEIERMERDHDREIRRKRRQTQRSRRITTNEPEQFKTNRTPIPKPKSKVEPDEEHATGSGSDEYSEEEVVRVSKRTRDL